VLDGDLVVVKDEPHVRDDAEGLEHRVRLAVVDPLEGLGQRGRVAGQSREGLGASAPGERVPPADGDHHLPGVEPLGLESGMRLRAQAKSEVGGARRRSPRPLRVQGVRVPREPGVLLV